MSLPPTEPAGSALSGIVGSSEAIKQVFEETLRVAPYQVSVLIIGETGTGKELVARATHRLSPRRDGPYVRVNCGALTESLLESELFGHVKGAFTGAIDNKTGRFEAAHKGTIFLDEISSMSAKLQVKLLRVLQESEFERVGESRTIRVDTRVIAATNQYLEDEVEAGRFRDDLYYRLNVMTIQLPPLRARREDIAELTRHFLQRHSQANGQPVPPLTPPFLRTLEAHDWPGNVRELENYLARAVVLADGRPLTTDLIAAPGRTVKRWLPLKTRGGDMQVLIQQLVRLGIQTMPDGNLAESIVGAVERELIEQVLHDCDQIGIKAAQRLGMNRNTLHKKVSEFQKGPQLRERPSDSDEKDDKVLG